MMTKWMWMIPGLLVAGCSSDDCDLLAALRSRAGKGAVDCGHAAVGGPTTDVDACVLAAFHERRAFFARYEQQGTDSRVEAGIAADADHNVTFLLLDSDPSGGGGADPTIDAAGCVGPSVGMSSQNAFATGPLTCASMTGFGRTCG
jgi:hypothetical protein